MQHPHRCLHLCFELTVAFRPVEFLILLLKKLLIDSSNLVVDLLLYVLPLQLQVVQLCLLWLLVRVQHLLDLHLFLLRFLQRHANCQVFATLLFNIEHRLCRIADEVLSHLILAHLLGQKLMEWEAICFPLWLFGFFRFFRQSVFDFKFNLVRLFMLDYHFLWVLFRIVALNYRDETPGSESMVHVFRRIRLLPWRVV